MIQVCSFQKVNQVNCQAHNIANLSSDGFKNRKCPKRGFFICGEDRAPATADKVTPYGREIASLSARPMGIKT